MVDRKLLKLARNIGWDIYLTGGNVVTQNPWLDISDYKVYSDQLKASYEEAKILFESDSKLKN